MLAPRIFPTYHGFGTVHAAAVAVCIILAMLAAPAAAHQTAMSTLNVQIHPKQRQVDMLLATSPADVGSYLELDPNGDGFLAQSEIPELHDAFGAYLGPRIYVKNNGRRCPTQSTDFVDADGQSSALLYRETAVCDATLGEVDVTNEVMLDAPKGYTHYGQIQVGDDVHTTVFTADNPSFSITVSRAGQHDKAGQAGAAAQSFWSVFADYTWQGILHILGGIDHVLFVICLLMAAADFRRLLKVITSFTVAHSITLALSALDVVTLAPAVVEPLIAVSIAWVALELIVVQRRDTSGNNADDGRAAGSIHGRHLLVLTFAFGLLHGFGFSYVLRDQVGLPTSALAPALFSFNVGVELGQIAVVTAAYPLVRWLRRQSWGWMIIQAASAVVLTASLHWLVQRVA